MIEPIGIAVEKATALLINPHLVRRIVISGRQRNSNPKFKRLDIRLVELKAGLHWQEVGHDGKQDFTRNIPVKDLHLARYFEDGYANLLIENEEIELSLRVTKSGQAQIVRKKAEQKSGPEIDLSHNRSKTRFLEENHPVFIELGISDHKGRLKPSRSDKFIQVQEFLKSIDFALQALKKRNPELREITIADLGCGHAYLTFAAHVFIKKSGFQPVTIGIDERVDSKERNQKIATALEIDEEITFQAEKISNLKSFPVDIVIALHACDTATDDAICWSVQSNASVVLVAPCCHHDLQKQIKDVPTPWEIATRYGILRERVGDIITDAIRAQVLRILGYKTEIIEFVAGDHTPRNLMIRSIKNDPVRNASAAEFSELDEIIEQWKINPILLNSLRSELASRRESVRLS